ncbi:MAG: hypothetical protein RQ754_01140 [Desulfuromonadales bacterium]|jgi:hypothetical protein|nr:hypothetical protein [Desulfuromonadales bacterium]
MTIKNPHRLFDEDRKLKTGKLVDIFWSKGGFSYRGRGRVVKLKLSTVTVALCEKVLHGEGYSVGSLITVPRIVDAASWSSHNCVRVPQHSNLAERVILAG